ncbi:hypothetical protein [Methylobacterium oryzae]|uniref:hypothetical protein n=1 Tax=Methylobacterium oryzae TaxID=334852 RepID=UPI002F33696B
MKNRHIIYGEDDKVLSQIAKDIREGDSSAEIMLRHARTFCDVDQVGNVHIVGDFPHIKAAYEAVEIPNGTDTPDKVKITEYTDEGEAVLNQPTGKVFEKQAADVDVDGEPGVPGVETPAAVAERGEQSTDPEPKQLSAEAADTADKKTKKGKKA